MESDFTVVVEGSKIKVPLKFREVSTYINGMMSLGFQQDEQVQVERVSKETFAEVLQFYHINNYEEAPIKTPIKSNQLENVMDKKNYEFIQKHDIKSEEFKKLYKAAEFLGCKNLFRICAARFACLIYFQDSKEAFEEKQKQLGVKVKIQFDDNEKFKKLYPFMNN